MTPEPKPDQSTAQATRIPLLMPCSLEEWLDYQVAAEASKRDQSREVTTPRLEGRAASLKRTSDRKKARIYASTNTEGIDL